MFLFLLFPLLSLAGLSSQCEISVKNVGQVCIVHYVKVRFSRLRYCRTDSFPFFSLEEKIILLDIKSMMFKSFCILLNGRSGNYHTKLSYVDLVSDRAVY